MKHTAIAFLLFLLSTISYAQKLNKELKDSISSVMKEIGEDDQKYRWQIMLGESDSLRLDSLKKLPPKALWKRIDLAMADKVGFNKNIRDSIELLQSKIDSVNKIAFINIIKKYGYPSKKRIGSDQSAFLILHITGPKEFEELMPIFRSELEKGNMPPSEFASWYDRSLLFMNKPQLFGEYDKEFPCVEDLKVTNTERKKIRLKRLKSNKCR